MQLKDYIGEATAYDKKLMLERKDPTSWLKSVSAFANTQSGRLLFGVANDGSRVGLADAQSDSEFISETIKMQMDPVPEIDLSLHEEDGKQFVVVEESIVNALIHRDYLEIGSEVHIDMFDDRLEVYSPGGMPSGELIQDLDAHYVPSTRRNPVIADLFQRLDLMERRGSGFGKIIDAYKVESDKRRIDIKPSFRSSATAFYVILPNLNYGLKTGSTTTVTTTDTVTKTVTKTGVKTVTKGVAKGGGDRHVQEGIFVDTPTIAELLGKDTAKVYRLLLQDGGMTISDMAKKLRLSSRGVRYHIEKIKNANLLRRVGGRKFGHWEVVK